MPALIHARNGDWVHSRARARNKTINKTIAGLATIVRRRSRYPTISLFAKAKVALPRMPKSKCVCQKVNAGRRGWRFSCSTQSMTDRMPSFRDICLGTTAGLAGSAAMHVFRLFWEPAVSRNSRHTIFGFDREADINGARLAYRLFSGDRLFRAAASQLGIAMHYGLGATFGMFYSLFPVHPLSPASLGALLWVFADEIPISASGISHPAAKSLASHAAALASHLLFGVVVTHTLRALGRKGAHPNG